MDRQRDGPARTDLLRAKRLLSLRRRGIILRADRRGGRDSAAAHAATLDVGAGSEGHVGRARVIMLRPARLPKAHPVQLPGVAPRRYSQYALTPQGYIYIHTHTHTYIPIHVFVYKYIYVYIYIYICTCIYTYTYSRTNIESVEDAGTINKRPPVSEHTHHGFKSEDKKNRASYYHQRI